MENAFVINEVCPHPDCTPESFDYKMSVIKPCFRHEDKAVGSEDAVVVLKSAQEFTIPGESEHNTNRAWAQMQADVRRARRRQ